MHAYDYAAFGRLIVPTALQGFNQLNADSVRDVRNACVRLRRLWAANRTYGALGGVRTYGAAFKATSDVGTISFVKTKRNRTHETHRTPKNQTSRLNSQVSDGL